MKVSVYTIIMLCLSNLVVAQKARVVISIANSSATEITFATPAVNAGNSLFTVPLDNNRTATYTFDVAKPQFIKLYCRSSAVRESKVLGFRLFLSPGDDLLVKADFARADFGISVTGKGSNNNQPLVMKMGGIETDKYYGDTLPYRIMTAIREEQRVEATVLNDYIKQYKPSRAFINAYHYNLQYMPIYAYYSFKENNKFQISDAYKRNFAQWQRLNDSLFSVSRLDNADALISSQYRGFIKDYLLREKEQLWTLSRTDPKAFYLEWYGTTPEVGTPLFEYDRSNLLQEKIINKHFTGAAAAYLYAALISDAEREANPTNIPRVFNRFKQRFPKSEYIAQVAPFVKKISEKDKNNLTAAMIFPKNNGNDLTSFDDVLNMMKGKTVLVDMWGTWCGPCRSEIDRNGEAIKKHFIDKDLSYLYIANHDEKNQKTWKELIAYFHMTGTHILASRKLSDDIMEKVKGSGYPTYIIIKKDGSYEISKAGYPMKREVLIEQLEQALAN